MSPDSATLPAPTMNHRAWAAVDLSAVRRNVALIRSLLPAHCAIMAVVKCNGYGHGDVQVATAALGAGATWLGVATAAEGTRLRVALPHSRIALLSPILASEAPAVVECGLTALVGSHEELESIANAAQHQRRTAEIHIELDTGMGRSGVLIPEYNNLLETALASPGIKVGAIATHFADAGRASAPQLERFLDAVRPTLPTGVLLHCAAGPAILCLPQAHLDIVRPGLLVYGMAPTTDCEPAEVPLRPVLSLLTRICQLRTMPTGSDISYGRTFQTSRTSRIATLAIGYGDGYPRSLSNRGEVILRGLRVPIVGTICMDVMMADVTNVPGAQVGDVVTLLGTDGKEQITANELAALASTIAHDITTRIAQRVARVYSE